MRSPGEIKRVIEARLSAYLQRDKTGIRRDLLKLFLKIRALTIAEIYSALVKRFTITYHAVASMVGIIASKLGILHVRKSADGSTSIYELKEQYVDLVKRIVRTA
jgi:hypothetical protein